MNSTQENKSNSSKFIFISVILVTILVILVLCLSFTAFKKATSEDGTNPSNDSNGNGGINSKISMTYTENMNGISIQDALLTSDEAGKHLNGKGEYFDFTIKSNVVNSSITYEIAAIKDKSSTISDDSIKLYLEKQNSGTYEQVMEPTIFKSITKRSKIGSPKGSMVLYKLNRKKSGTDNYRLRMWIKEDAVVEMDKSYTVKVNVYGKAS